MLISNDVLLAVAATHRNYAMQSNKLVEEWCVRCDDRVLFYSGDFAQKLGEALLLQ